MTEKTITITEKDGEYNIQSDGLTRFELVGILECAAFDLKNGARSEISVAEATESVREPNPENVAPQTEESRAEAASPVAETSTAESPAAADIRVRIGNAVKAIRSLGGQAAEADLSAATEEELQAQLEKLKNQYKRLKALQKPK